MLNKRRKRAELYNLKWKQLVLQYKRGELHDMGTRDSGPPATQDLHKRLRTTVCAGALLVLVLVQIVVAVSNQ